MNLSLFSLITLFYAVFAIDDYFQKIAPRKPSRYNVNYNTAPSLKHLYVPHESLKENFDIKPESKILYNFELVRRDQPSHFVNIVEDVANYLRPKADSSKSSFRVSNRMIPETILVNENHENEFSPIEGRVSIPDAPLLHSSIFTSQMSSDNRNYEFHEGGSEQRDPRIVATTQSTVTQDLDLAFDGKDVVTNEHLRWSPEIFGRNKFQDYEFGRKLNNQVTAIGTTSTTKMPDYRHGLANRGKHKFNYNDLETVDVPQSTTENVSFAGNLRHHKTPPPVPTLSPWYDGFGK